MCVFFSFFFLLYLMNDRRIGLRDKLGRMGKIKLIVRRSFINPAFLLINETRPRPEYSKIVNDRTRKICGYDLI